MTVSRCHAKAIMGENDGHIEPYREVIMMKTAAVWAEKTPSEHEFECLDSKLKDAVLREGFTVLPGKFRA
jgi:hypothetical protein